jgi:PEGA domain
MVPASMLTRRVLPLIISVALAMVTVNAAGADAASLVRDGVQLRSVGKDEAALRAFEAAAKLEPSPTITAQIALAEQALGMWASAERHMQEAIDAAADPWIIKNRRTLEDALATVREHLGTLDIECRVDGAEVWVDGIRVGTLPQSAHLRLETGKRQLELRRDGYQSTRRVVSISDRTVARETIALATWGTESAADPSAQPRKAAAKPEEGHAGELPPGRTQRGIGAVALIAGGGALLFAGGAAIVTESITQSFNGNPRCDRPEQDASCRDQLVSRKTWGTLAITTTVVGGVLTVAGIVALLTAPESSAQDGKRTRSLSQLPVTAGLRCTPSLSGLACSGQF